MGPVGPAIGLRPPCRVLRVIGHAAEAHGRRGVVRKLQDGVAGGAARAEPERHAGLDVFNRLSRGLFFKRFGGHGVSGTFC